MSRKCTREEREILGRLRDWPRGYEVCPGTECAAILESLKLKGWAVLHEGKYWHFLTAAQTLTVKP